jgi:SAM-dependent methyltransferase
MYNSLKKVITTIFPKIVLFRIEPYIRNCYAFLKIGNQHFCSVCEFKSTSFERLPNSDLLCPKCGSLARDRRLCKTISETYLLPNLKILDFSPSRSLFRKWKKVHNIKYIASDLSGDFISDVSYDIIEIPEKENQFDLIICYHILEHVIHDIKAMNELYRVLKSNGTILIQTPFKDGDIYEDYTITSETERLRHFGQDDHVRIYSINGLKKRLESVGFSVSVNDYKKDEYLGFLNEIVLIATK